VVSLHVAVVGAGAPSRELAEMLCALGEPVQVSVVLDSAAEAPSPPPPGVRTLSLEEMVALGEAVDIIFDLGDAALRRRLRQALFASDNHHTVIAPPAVARLVWLLAGRRAPSDRGGGGGY